MSFVLFILIIFSFYAADFQLVFILAFLTGFLSDLFLGNFLGFSSLIFLSLVFLIFLYRQKFSSSHILFQLVFVLVFSLFFNWLKGAGLSFKKSIPFLFLTLVIFIILNKAKQHSQVLTVEA